MIEVRVGSKLRWGIAIGAMCVVAAAGFRPTAPLLAGSGQAASRASVAPYKLANVAGRAWIVAPDGTRFVPFGINHLSAAVAPNGEGRELTAVERAARLRQMRDDLQAWHFNTVGYDAPAELWDELPFIAASQLTQVQHVRPAGQAVYDDVFAPEFHAKVRRQVEALCARTRDNPRCIGYWWTDTPRWDLEIAQRVWGKTWVSSLRELPDGAPGRERYREFLRGPGPHDDRVFLGLIARELYAVTASAFREFAPGRLIFGERYKLGDHPPEVLREAAQFIDVLSIQPGPEVGPLAGPGRDETHFDAARFDALHALTGKPILICDHQVSFRDPDYPVTLWNQFPTQTEAARSYEQFLSDAFSRPYVVGYFRCQYWNQWMPAPRNLLKQGLRRSDGELYADAVRLVAEINRRQLERLNSEH